MRTNTDHVVCDAKDGGAFRCLHCGDRYMPALPQPLAIFCESAKGYALMHKHCPKQAPPSRQVELFDALAAKEQTLAEASRAALERIEAAEAEEYETEDECSARTVREEMGIDGMSDSPDPETDPPQRCHLCGMTAGLHHIGCGIGAPGIPEQDKPELTDQDDPFGQRYPMARDHLRLRTNLSVVLQGVLTPTLEQLQALPVGSAGFDKIAHWTRIESARMNLTEHPELEVYLPTGQAMPKELAAMRKALKELTR